MCSMLSGAKCVTCHRWRCHPLHLAFWWFDLCPGVGKPL